jgi:valyl-tRNA synthetase
VRPSTKTWTDDERVAGLRLNELAESARRFVWNELADWYLEASKGRLLTPGADADVARSVLVHVFDQALRLLHPIVPFVTEALWQRLPGHVDGTWLATSGWPVARATVTEDGPADFELIKELVEAVRSLRSEYAIAPGKGITGYVEAPPATRDMLREEAALVARLARTELAFVEWEQKEPAANVVLSRGTSIVVPFAGLVDVKKECDRLALELASLEKQLTALEGRLGNPGFVNRAPAHVIEGERTKREEWTTRAGQLRSRYEGLCGKR